MKHSTKQIEPWKQYSILIVDDEPSVLGELSAVMRLDGLDVHRASSGEEGLSVLETVPAKVVISDQLMDPGMKGTEFLAEVHQRHPDVVTMILSAYSDIEYVLDAMNKAKAFQYITKPWNNQDVIGKVHQALAFYHAKAEQKRMAEANQHLLRKMAFSDNLLMMGGFSTTLFERFFPVLKTLLREADEAARMYPQSSDKNFRALMEKERWSELCVILNKLRLMADVYHAKPKFQELSVVPLVRACVEEAVAMGAEQGIRIDARVREEASVPTLWIDAEVFGFALRAVIENAVLACGKGGSLPERAQFEVVIGLVEEGVDSSVASASPQGDAAAEGAPNVSLVIDVHDAGHGVATPLVDKIFTPLFSTRSAPAPELQEIGSLASYNFSMFNHVGLGLPIAMSCMAQHDGSVRLRRSDAGGASFRLEIPTSQPGLQLAGLRA